MEKNPSWERVLEAASGDVRRLSYVDRYTSIPVSFKENVAEHSFWVAIYSSMIHEEIDGSEYFLAPILSHALVHDVVECISGDLVRTFKYSTPELKKAVDAAEDKLSHGFPDLLKKVMALPWQSIQNPDDVAYVKAVVKTADFVSLHQYMVRERLRGNHEIEPFFRRMQADLHMMAEKFQKETIPQVKCMSGLFDLMSQTENVSKRTT